jgi:hypothetical protein
MDGRGKESERERGRCNVLGLVACRDVDERTELVVVCQAGGALGCVHTYLEFVGVEHGWGVYTYTGVFPAFLNHVLQCPSVWFGFSSMWSWCCGVGCASMKPG